MLKVFNLPFSKWKLLLLAGDLVIFWVSALLGLLFNPEGNLSSFVLEIMKYDGTINKNHNWIIVKTQFGTVDAHITTVKLLRYLKKNYIPDLEVKDEGEYWETNDKEHLMGKRAFLAGKIAQVEQALSSIEIEDEITPEELADKIEEVFRKLQNKRK